MDVGRNNLELARTINRAFNEGGTEAVVPYYSEEFEWHMPDGWLEKDVYRGRDGIRELANAWFGQFDEYRWDEIELSEIDADRILGLYQMRGTSKGSGVPAEQPIGLILTFREGLIVRVDSFFGWDEARSAADVRA
jgi:ketosteroid isomerase-like protein